jgi:hypothetical protein
MHGHYCVTDLEGNLAEDIERSADLKTSKTELRGGGGGRKWKQAKVSIKK